MIFRPTTLIICFPIFSLTDENTSTSYGIYDVLSDAVLDCVEEERLPLEVYEELVFPIYFRTIAEAIPGDHPRPYALDKIYQRAEQRLAADPARYEFHYISIGVLLTRV